MGLSVFYLQVSIILFLYKTLKFPFIRLRNISLKKSLLQKTKSLFEKKKELSLGFYLSTNL